MKMSIRKTYRRKTSCRKSGKRKQRSMKRRGGAFNYTPNDFFNPGCANQFFGVEKC